MRDRSITAITTEGVKYGFGTGGWVNEPYRPVTHRASAARGSIKQAVHLDRTGVDFGSVRAVLLLAKRIKHSFDRVGIRTDRKHRSHIIGAAPLRGAVQGSLFF